jgi:hypothetical protein
VLPALALAPPADPLLFAVAPPLNDSSAERPVADAVAAVARAASMAARRVDAAHASVRAPVAETVACVAVASALTTLDPALSPARRSGDCAVTSIAPCLGSVVAPAEIVVELLVVERTIWRCDAATLAPAAVALVRTAPRSRITDVTFGAPTASSAAACVETGRASAETLEVSAETAVGAARSATSGAAKNRPRFM